ncbi:fatty acid desaturase family protein [Burkholderia pseudomallei]|uniref:fatty acid desaturase family protein n=1 Tax=Burkholderia pseudomallei TaxID=28450 RepID=UPI00048CCA44|nr:fatty acid desaturase [Burkholderia pseudomallei]AJX95583.1 fatty acid desaturase family protein [Burkholderia pseudomallei PB08298010]
MRSTAPSSIAADQAAIHSSITATGRRWPSLQPSTWRSLLDVIVDWIVIGVAAWGAFRIGRWAPLLAIFVIGNRQRALGNLLHDAGHRNLSAQRSINDSIAQIFLAPPLLSSLELYRQRHARHHAWLGDRAYDPDFIPYITHRGDRWFHAYVRVLTHPPTWAGSLFGHVLTMRLTPREWLKILLWWGTYEGLLVVAVNMHFALLFISLWMIARGTVFHAITTFREMTDHYGLEPKGIFRYTRDIPNHGLVSVLLHPHHNGYHLTHHLFPHVPYYHLPHLHGLLKQVPFFDRHAIICRAYISGSRPAVDGWGARHV